MSFGKKLVSVCALLLLVQSASALPPDRHVYFAVHQNPDNPTSPIQYYFTLDISAVSQDGNDIGWAVTSFSITELVTLGNDIVWSLDDPFVDTTDGLWWVTHADPDNPVRFEFTLPAHMADTALAEDPSNADLDFDMQGESYTAPPGGAPYEVTAALDFSLTLSTTPAGDPPDDSGDDEPVDLPDGPNDPHIGAQ